MISLPTVSRMSRGGMQVIMESLRKSGVPMAWFHCSGVGRSTTTPRSSRIFTRLSRHSLPRSTVLAGRRPHMPRISESTGTFSDVAGSSGGIIELSQRPTITRFNGSQSFQELTIFAMTVSFLRRLSMPPYYVARTLQTAAQLVRLPLKSTSETGASWCLRPSVLVVASLPDSPMPHLYHLFCSPAI